MATTFEFVVACARPDSARAARALADGHELVARLERELSEFLPDSCVTLLNQAPVGERVALGNHALELLELSRKVRRASRGAFSCTAKSRVSGADREDSLLGWDRATGQAWRLDPGARLSYGAIGKGYALDCVRRLLEQAGFRDFLLNAGGSSVILSGFAGPERRDPWRWGWSWKKNGEGEALGLTLAHGSGAAIAIGVSGTHEQGLHLLDPRTGAAVEAMKSALVAHASAAEADALSTAVFVGGWDASLAALQGELTPPALACIDDAEVPRWNGLFAKLWGGLAAASALAVPAARADDDAVDLGGGTAGAPAAPGFTPYIFDRSSAWMLLPGLSILLVLLHLKRFRRTSR